jgi:hypothetical protein
MRVVFEACPKATLILRANQSTSPAASAFRSNSKAQLAKKPKLILFEPNTLRRLENRVALFVKDVTFVLYGITNDAK